ncbi:MAG TPA: hypothetical protein VJ179_01105 [Patescibacteria group bacterium]|nr:hypothetical protein [Patescibacteria group bacterium]
MVQESLSQQGNLLVEAYEGFLKETRKDQSQEQFRAQSLFGVFAFLYEKLRNVVEYKGEHLLRRISIERTLKRLRRTSRTPGAIAERLVRELIWGRYIGNESISLQKLDVLSQRITKYQAFRGELFQENPDPGLRFEWEEWLLGVESSEIEETLVPSFVRTVMVQAMYAWFTSRFVWTNDKIDLKEKEVQLFIAVHRSLAKSDAQLTIYHLLKLYVPQWDHLGPESFSYMAHELPALRKKIEAHLTFSDSHKVFRVVQKYTAPFLILSDVLDRVKEDAHEVLSNQELLEREIRFICVSRYAQLRQRISHGIVRSIIYIFITKVLFALLLELPYEYYFLSSVRLFPLAVNIVLPPFLMFLVGLTIKIPGEENTKRIINRVNDVLHGEEPREKAVIQFQVSRRNAVVANIFTFLYVVLFLALVGGIAYILQLLEFSIVSSMIFFAFLSLVLLFGYRVKWQAQDLFVTGKEEGLIGQSVNILTLPFLNLGLLLSAGLARINFFTFLLDVIIDAPLKTMVGAVEAWVTFMREKREEVVEVPQE